MSKAIRCDRCGACFDQYSMEGECGTFKDFFTRTKQDFVNNEVSYRDEEIDLCPDCLASFNRWFEYGKVQTSNDSFTDIFDRMNDKLERLRNILNDSQKTQGV